MPMFSQQTTADFLRPLPHVREDMVRDTLAFQVSYNPELCSQAGYASVAAEFRVDGRDENRNPPGPLKVATIGSNGRDMVTGQVHFIGIDIDGANHAKGHTDLESLIQRLAAVSWLYIIRSRSGRGYHLYGFPAREIFAEDNSAMYPLGAAFVQAVAEASGVDDLQEYVDCAGSLMFYYSPNPGERGYEVVKEATELFTEPLEPLYDPGIPEHDVADLKELEPDHVRIVDYLTKHAKKDFHQVGAGNLFHAHTSDLPGCQAALNLRGKFETVATGNGDTKRNCCMIAITGGAFIVVQWGSSNETSWKLSSRGCRYVLFNAAPPFAEFVDSHNLIQDQRSKSFCITAEQAAELAELHGVQLPESKASHFMVSESRGKIVFEIEVKPNDTLPGWTRKSKLKACFVIATTTAKAAPASRVRVAYSVGGKNFQLFRRVHRDYWHPTTYEDAQTRLRLFGLEPVQIDRVLTTDSPLEIVSEPFRPEFPGRNQWNRASVQLAFKPATESGPYHHWRMILNHCGAGFNEAVANDLWCQSQGIKDGADYLMMWDARLLRAPKERLPGIALYSEMQNCGKSTYGSSRGKLMTRGGYLNSPSPLTSNFNGPLLGCVLWDLDDVDLAQRSGELYRRLQPWMTHDDLVVEGKGMNPITVANCLHVIHTANQLDCFSIQPGDTRWIIGEVSELEHEIPAAEFTRALMREAPYYLRALFDLSMPKEAAGRMFLPVLDTPLKFQLMAKRSERALTPEQGKLLQRLKELAAINKLSDLTDFETLKPMLGLEVSARAFTAAWPKMAPVLTDAGYECSNRQNNGGRYPAAWSIQQPKGKSNEPTAMESGQLSRVA